MRKAEQSRQEHLLILIASLLAFLTSLSRRSYNGLNHGSTILNNGNKSVDLEFFRIFLLSFITQPLL
jgi:hypothetical protein